MSKVEEITQQQLAKRIYDSARAKAILANQNANAHNEVLKRTPAWKGNVKKYGNPLILELIKQEKAEFALIEKAEIDMNMKNVIDEAFERSGKIIQLLARMVFTDYDEVEMVLMALAKDKSSMLGIAKKTLR